MIETDQSIQLYTSLYQMDTSDIDHDVTHLFEHVLIAAFAKEARKHGFHPSLIGWVSGESFEERLFIDTGFYQHDVDRLFYRFMKHLPEFDKEIIQQELAVLEAEERVTITPLSPKQLSDKLDILRTRKWNTTFNLPASIDKPKKILELHKKAGTFRRITVDVYIPVNTLTQEEQFVFLRAHVFMMDIVHDFLRKNYASYEYEHSDIMIRDNKIGFGLDHTIRRGVATVRQIGEATEKMLRTFPLDQYTDQIQAHIDVYSRHLAWRHHPIDYFRETGLSPTPQMIAELATPERIASLFKKVQVRVVPND